MKVTRRSLLYLIRGFKHQFFPLGYSESGEDLIASYLIGNSKGRFCDVGAGHPVVGSNSYMFYRRGWNGVAIDLNEDLRTAWQVIRPRDLFICAAIGSKNSNVEFFEYKNDLRSTLSKQVEKYYSEQSISHIKRNINQITLNQVFETHFSDPGDVVLSIDIEGLEFEVLQAFDFSRFNPSLIVVESWSFPWSKHNPINKLLEDADYCLVAYSGLSAFYMKIEKMRKMIEKRPLIKS